MPPLSRHVQPRAQLCLTCFALFCLPINLYSQAVCRRSPSILLTMEIHKVRLVRDSMFLPEQPSLPAYRQMLRDDLSKPTRRRSIPSIGLTGTQEGLPSVLDSCCNIVPFPVDHIAGQVPLHPKRLVSFLQAHKFFFWRNTSLASKDHLSVQLPSRRDLPLVHDVCINNRVVVLQANTQALCVEREPDGVLNHGVRLGCPHPKVTGVGRESRDAFLDNVLVLEKQNL